MKAHHDHDARHRADRRLLHARPSTASAAATTSGSSTRSPRSAAQAFSERWSIPEHTTDLTAAIEHPDTDVVVVGLPNYLHEEAVGLAAAAGKAVLCTKPLGRTADEARRMLETVEKAGVFGGYLEDLCYTPKTLKAVAVGRGRRDRRRDLGPLARDASRARTARGSGTAG